MQRGVAAGRGDSNQPHPSSESSSPFDPTTTISCPPLPSAPPSLIHSPGWKEGQMRCWEDWVEDGTLFSELPTRKLLRNFHEDDEDDEDRSFGSTRPALVSFRQLVAIDGFLTPSTVIQAPRRLNNIVFDLVLVKLPTAVACRLHAFRSLAFFPGSPFLRVDISLFRCVSVHFLYVQTSRLHDVTAHLVPSCLASQSQLSLRRVFPTLASLAWRRSTVVPSSPASG